MSQNGKFHDLPPAETAQTPERQRIINLAKLSPLEYDKVRAAEAQALGIRVSTLDAEVDAIRPSERSGNALAFTDPEPFAHHVHAEPLLHDLLDVIERYVALPKHAADALALWILHTWVYEAFYVSPYLLIRSPGKRCGKTTLVNVLRPLVRRPLTASSASTATIYRTIEQYHPTFLLDEVDNWLRENPELRGVLCGGHTKGTAFVMRMGGENRDQVERFSTFCPKALSGIGRLADTLEDRSVPIKMKRKLRTDNVTKMREDQYEHEVAILQSMCCRWAQDHLEQLRRADPKVPAELNDRAADNWRPLFAIAELGGEDWVDRANKAARALSGENETDDEAISAQLFGDIRALFERRDVDRLASLEIVEELSTMEERRWPEWKNGKPITQTQLAALLKPFEIVPRLIAIGVERARGYHHWQFEDAFSRWLPSSRASEPSQGVTPLPQHELSHNDDAQPVTSGGNAKSSDPLPVTFPVPEPVESNVVTGSTSPAVTPSDDAKPLENKQSNAVTGQRVTKEPSGGVCQRCGGEGCKWCCPR